jgi:hypothetical protein
MRSFFTLLFAIVSLSYYAQFMGSIDFTQYTLKDTALNTYWIKDKKVRLNQYAKNHPDLIEGSFVFDLDAKTIKFVNPKRKVWGDQKSEIPPVLKGKCEVSKGKAKTHNGQKCTEYVVKNTEENTVITYYVVTGNYDFFMPMMELWNHKSKQSIYFGKIKGLPKGSMPIWSEERQISDNKFISKLEATKFNKAEVEASKLEVPGDYKKFDQ